MSQRSCEGDSSMTAENLLQTMSEILGALASGIAIYNAIRALLVKQEVSKTNVTPSRHRSFIYATMLLIVGIGVVWILNLASCKFWEFSGGIFTIKLAA
jgi:hypothetical protein